jgi:excisionase family DNA binding protein
MPSPKALTPHTSERTPVKATSTPRSVPRLLRIADAADYLSCTFGFIETLYREGTIKPVLLGKRHLLDIRDLDAYIEQLKETA